MNRIFTKDLNRRIGSSPVHFMSKAIATAENSPATKLHGLMKFGSNESNSKNFQESPKPPSDHSLLNVKCPKKTGELYDDQEDLLNAALSVHSAREQACSNPFWKKIEPFFAAVTAEDLLFLKSVLHSAEELNQIQSQDVYKHDCSSEGEYNSLKQQCAHLFEDFGIRKISSEFPSLFQRNLSAIIVEDEDREGVESKLDLQSQMCFMAEKFSSIESGSSNTDKKESMSSFFSSNDHLQSNDALLYSDKGFLNVSGEIDAGSQYSLRGMSFFDNKCQVPPQDDRVLQELHSIGLCTETMLHSKDEERVDQEIKKLEELQHQQAAKVKSYLEIIDKAVQSAQDLGERNTEEFALDQLTAMAYRRTMGGRRIRSKLQKEADLALHQRTLARCREFEDTGRTCFRQPNLQLILFSAPSPGKDAKTVKGKDLTIGSSSESRKMCSKVDAAGSVGRPNTSHRMLPLGSSSSQQGLPHSSKQKNAKSKPSSRKDKVVKRDMKPEPKRIKLTRTAAREKGPLRQQSKD